MLSEALMPSEPAGPVATAKRIAKKVVSRLNYIGGRYRRKLFILGDGRSGTTWLMNIFNFDQRYRIMFEPFDTVAFPKRPDYASELPFPDAAPGGPVDQQVRSALRGDYLTVQVTYHFPKLLYSGLLIKDVSAHLILDNLLEKVPDLPSVLILRHPFAVADSKARAYHWTTQPAAFLSPQCPFSELLEPHRHLIESFRDDIERHVIVWCLIHSIAFRARCMGSFSLVFYEDLVADPMKEVSRLYEELGMRESLDANRPVIEAACVRKSHVTNAENTIQRSREGMSRWQDEWTPERIDRCLGILAAFGLDAIYGNQHAPLMDAAGLGNWRETLC
jgi:hypothetical protein